MPKEPGADSRIPIEEYRSIWRLEKEDAANEAFRGRDLRTCYHSYARKYSSVVVSYVASLHSRVDVRVEVTTVRYDSCTSCTEYLPHLYHTLVHWQKAKRDL